MRWLILPLLCVYGTTVWPQTTESTAPPRADQPPSAERKSMDLLAKFHAPESVVWLQAQGEEFLALYHPALRGKAKGSVVLLHAEGQHPAWPGPLNYLRQRLPELGWNTLSIALPDPGPASNAEPSPATQPPPAEVLDETEEVFDPSTDTVSDGSLVPQPKPAAEATLKSEDQAVERIVAAVDHLKSQNLDTVVIYGQGLGTLRASRYWHETGDNAVKALIFVDGRNAVAGSQFQLPQALNNPRMPVLDIIHSRSLNAELDAKQRAEKAARMEMRAYQQHWFAENDERLTNMVYGFLRRNVVK